jgi:hypothetical protein
MADSIQVSTSKRISLHEDWTVVILGFLIIILSIAGFVIPVPSFSWKNSEELFSKVLSAENFGKAALQFVFVFVIALMSVYLINKSVKNALKTFPLLFALTLSRWYYRGTAK